MDRASRPAESLDVISRLVPLLLLAVTSVSGADDPIPSASPAPLDQQLRREDPAALARDARKLGDARRGALVFYQPALTCTRCHVNEKADAAAPTLGPDLAAIGKDVPDAELVESILEPSKVDQEGLRAGHDRHRRRPDDHRPAGRGAARRGRPPRPRAGRQAGHDRQGPDRAAQRRAGRR